MALISILVDFCIGRSSGPVAGISDSSVVRTVVVGHHQIVAEDVDDKWLNSILSRDDLCVMFYSIPITCNRMRKIDTNKNLIFKRKTHLLMFDACIYCTSRS